MMRLRTLAISAAAAALLTAAPAQAQIFGNWGHDNQYRVDTRRIAYDNGYQRGLDKGNNAVRDRKAFNVEREKDYRNADWGYRGDYGNRDRYRNDFRRGFAEGYNQAYARYQAPVYRDGRNGGYYPSTGQRYPNSYPSDGRVYGGVPYGGGRTEVAFRNGVNDGYQKGRDDASHGRYPQAEGQKWYREGDHNYNSRDGISRAEYENVYRRGFQEGYARAYSERRR